MYSLQNNVQFHPIDRDSHSHSSSDPLANRTFLLQLAHYLSLIHLNPFLPLFTCTHLPIYIEVQNDSRLRFITIPSALATTTLITLFSFFAPEATANDRTLGKEGCLMR